MPPQLQALLQNRRLLAIIGGSLVLVLVLIVVLASQHGGGSKDPSDAPLSPEQKNLATINGYGKAIEIQALLARQGIHLKQDDKEGESKIKLIFEETAHEKDRDKALITLVQSGLMDKNVGLESFDKGDLTASREEKRIKLIRAQQGELMRLIKKIDPIEDASVSIAIPEPTLFRSEEKPLSASVQVTLPAGTRLTHDKVKAITNLMVGSLQGLATEHVSISDTNGNTYNSILDATSNLDDKLEEQDNYMKQKLVAQLDRLVGAGNYVVSVSTQLRQAPRETMVQEFDPQGGVVNTKQTFQENVNGSHGQPEESTPNSPGGPVSSLLPSSFSSTNTSMSPGNLSSSTMTLSPNASASGANKGKEYVRNGLEVSYNNSKTQTMETQPIGMIEDISIAVTIDNSHFPDISPNDLRILLARAASPKVNPENVKIVTSGHPRSMPLDHIDTAATSSTGSPAMPDLTWLYWAIGSIVFSILMLALLSNKKPAPVKRLDDEMLLETRHEVQQLKAMTAQQQVQLQAAQQQAQQLLQEQVENNKRLEEKLQEVSPASTGSLQQMLTHLRESVAQQEEEVLNLQIKNWIESS